MVMLLVGEWCCWRELCVCGHDLLGRCEGYSVLFLCKSTQESFLDHKQFVNTICK
jgi:hypothetical protein